MNSRATSALLAVLALGISGCRTDPPVGFLGMLSGPRSELGVAGRDGAMLYAEREGYRVVSCDTRGDPSATASCVRALADSGVRVVIGPMASVEVDSAIATAERQGLLLVSPTVSTHRLQGVDDAFLRVIGSNLEQADTLAALLSRDKFRHILLLWETANAAYGRSIAERIEERLRAGPGKATLLSIGYRTDLDLSFDSIVSAHPEADAIVTTGSAMEAALLCRSVARMGSRAKLFGSQYAMGSDLLRVGGKDAAGMVLAAAAPHGDSTPQRMAFVRVFRQRYRREPPFGAFFAWEAAAASREAWSAGEAGSAKKRILARASMAPLGDTFYLDRFGDVHRRIVPHVVREGRFEVRR